MEYLKKEYLKKTMNFLYSLFEILGKLVSKTEKQETRVETSGHYLPHRIFERCLRVSACTQRSPMLR